MTDPRVLIKKDNLTSASKLMWLFVGHRISPTAAENILTWDREIRVAAMVVGFEIYVVRFLISVIHDRDFKASTTYPFSCMIFQLCRNAGVPIWHIGFLRTPTGQLILVSLGMRPMRRHHGEGPSKCAAAR